jgi:hypothetical protein
MKPYEVSTPLSWQMKRLAADGSFAGYASVFDVVDVQGDRVLPGAFAASLARWRGGGQLPPFLWQHDMAEPIGRFDLVAEDGQGLRVEGRLALDTRRGREAQSLLRLGALDGLSIGYSAVTTGVDGQGVRLLKVLDLHEISLVTLPANEAARIAWVKAAPGTETTTAAIAANLRRATAALRA